MHQLERMCHQYSTDALAAARNGSTLAAAPGSQVLGGNTSEPSSPNTRDEQPSNASVGLGLRQQLGYGSIKMPLLVFRGSYT